jgi:chromatin segregation and condensation protein Rec8/ScpA/Scc1 (kleisin family)
MRSKSKRKKIDLVDFSENHSTCLDEASKSSLNIGKSKQNQKLKPEEKISLSFYNLLILAQNNHLNINQKEAFGDILMFEK